MKTTKLFKLMSKKEVKKTEEEITPKAKKALKDVNKLMKEIKDMNAQDKLIVLSHLSLKTDKIIADETAALSKITNLD